MGKSKGVGTTADCFRFDPDILVIDGEGSPLFDPDSNASPIDDGLVKNIMAMGVIEPIEFTRREGKIIVVNGRRRVRHAREANNRLKKAGKEPITIPGIPKRGTEDVLLGMMVSANEFRREKLPMERAKQAARLLNAGKTEDEIGIHFGVDPNTVRNWLKILECSPAVHKAMNEGLIKPTTAAQFAGLSAEEQKEKLEKLLDASTGKATGAKARRIVGNKKPKQGILFPAPTRKEIEEVALTDKIPPVAKHALLWVLGKEERAWK